MRMRLLQLLALDVGGVHEPRQTSSASVSLLVVRPLSLLRIRRGSHKPAHPWVSRKTLGRDVAGPPQQ